MLNQHNKARACAGKEVGGEGAYKRRFGSQVVSFAMKKTTCFVAVLLLRQGIDSFPSVQLLTTFLQFSPFSKYHIILHSK